MPVFLPHFDIIRILFLHFHKVDFFVAFFSRFVAFTPDGVLFFKPIFNAEVPDVIDVGFDIKRIDYTVKCFGVVG
jgi:hypothetical protein